MLRVVTILAFCILYSVASAQNVLTKAANIMRNGDYVSMHEIPFFFFTESGSNCEWNITEDIHNNIQTTLFVTDTTNTIYRISEEAVCKYIQSEETLQQTFYDDYLRHIEYSNPIVVMRYPFRYNDTITDTFEGKGTYCTDHKLVVKGQTFIEADASGSLIYGSDTLPNTIRVHTLTISAFSTGADSATIDSTDIKHQITETYEWYAKGYRYPMLKTIQKTSYRNMRPVDKTENAYIITPEEYYTDIKDDIINDSIRHNANITTKNNVSISRIWIDGNMINIKINTDQPAKVTTLLSDSQGIIHKYNTITYNSSLNF